VLPPFCAADFIKADAGIGSWGLVEWIAYSCRRFRVDKLLIEAKAKQAIIPAYVAAPIHDQAPSAPMQASPLLADATSPAAVPELVHVTPVPPVTFASAPAAQARPTVGGKMTNMSELAAKIVAGRNARDQRTAYSPATKGPK
jgi:hypothetical protein